MFPASTPSPSGSGATELGSILESADSAVSALFVISVNSFLRSAAVLGFLPAMVDRISSLFVGSVISLALALACFNLPLLIRRFALASAEES